MRKIIIRKALESDLDIIIEYFKKLGIDMYNYGYYAISSLDKNWAEIKEKIKSNINDTNYIYLIAETSKESKPVGYAEARFSETFLAFESIKQLHISCVYVEPAHRNIGIGKSIIDELVRIGKERGCKEVELSVLVNNPAFHMYKKMGFNEFTILMRKNIA